MSKQRQPKTIFVHARLFIPRRERKNKPRAAVVVLPQWNAQTDSHVEAWPYLQSPGHDGASPDAAYHEERRPPEIERAEHLVSSTSVARFNQCVRQSRRYARCGSLVEGTRFERIGILGTARIVHGSFSRSLMTSRLMSAYSISVRFTVADVVWKGISTHHVKQAIETNVTLEELRDFETGSVLCPSCRVWWR